MSSDACSPQSRLKEAVETSKEAGGASLRKPDEFKAVCEAVAGIALDDDDAALETAKEVAIKIKELCKDASLMTEMMNQLHESSVASETLGCQTAVVFGCLSQLEVEGVKCRNVFLRRIQQDFASKTKAQDEDDDADINLQDHFRLISFLCQVFRRVRVADGTTIAALASPIIKNLSDVFVNNEIGRDEKSAFLVSKQLQMIGPELKHLKPDEFQGLIGQLRKFLSTSKLSQEGFLSLMLIVELNCGSDWGLAESGLTFYNDVLPEEVRVNPMEVSKAPILKQAAQESQSLPLLPDMSRPPPNFASRPRFQQQHHHHNSNNYQQQQHHHHHNRGNNSYSNNNSSRYSTQQQHSYTYGSRQSSSNNYKSAASNNTWDNKMAARTNSWSNNDSKEWKSGDWNEEKSRSDDHQGDSTWTKQQTTSTTTTTTLGDWTEEERSAGWSKPANAANADERSAGWSKPAVTANADERSAGWSKPANAANSDERSAGWSKPAGAANAAQWSTEDDSGFNIGTWDIKEDEKRNDEKNNATDEKAASNWTAMPEQSDW